VSAGHPQITLAALRAKPHASSESGLAGTAMQESVRVMDVAGEEARHTSAAASCPAAKIDRYLILLHKFEYRRGCGRTFTRARSGSGARARADVRTSRP
jgi:hypothetical protein